MAQRHSASSAPQLADDNELAQQPSSVGRVRRSARSAGRASPYARTPTNQLTRANNGPVTPTPGASPSMLGGFMSMISPFRSYSRARQSAAFGSADDEQDGDEQEQQLADDQDMEGGAPTEDAQQPQEPRQGTLDESRSSSTSTNMLTVLTTAPFAASPTRSRPGKLDFSPSGPSARSRGASPRASAPLPARTASRSPLAESSSVLPFTPQEPPRTRATRHSSQADLGSHGRMQLTDVSPVSRNFDLLARFFAEKQREGGLHGGSSGLTEVEVEGCLKLIEDSMSAGRDLANEFGGPPASSRFDPYHAAGSIGFGLQQQAGRQVAASSRASLIAPGPGPAFLASQTYGDLFHPGSTSSSSKRLPAEGAYSFLAPRSSSTASIASAAAANRRHRPLYLGPGMGSQLARRRTLAPASKSLADSLVQSRRSWLPKSTSDNSLVDAARDRQRQQQVDAPAVAPEEPKRRRMEEAGSQQQQNARFESRYESHMAQSSELAKTTSSSVAGGPSKSESTGGFGLKRSAPLDAVDDAASQKPVGSSSYVNGVRPAQDSTPQRAPTRTAAAMLDILKESPPIRPTVQPELINPYQTSSTLSSKLPKKPKTQTASKSARASMTTRARARQSASAASYSKDKDEDEAPKRESILDVIERTAPKEKARRGRSVTETPEVLAAVPEQKTAEPVSSNPNKSASTDAANSASADAAEARKLEKTEEARRRLAALSKSRDADKKQEQPAAPTTTFTFGASTGGTAPSTSSQQQQQQPSSAPSSTSFSFGSAKPATSLAPQLPPQYTASKPKKPSPLSATFQAPDSPSSASEKSMTDSPVPASKPAFGLSQPTFSFGSPSIAPKAGLASTAATAAPTPFSFGSLASTDKAAPVQSAPPAAAPTQVSSAAATATKPAFSLSPIIPTASAGPSSAPATISAPAKTEVKAALAPTATPVTKLAATPKSPQEEALAASKSSLPAFSFDFSPSPTSSSAANGSEKDSAAAITREVASLAATSLPKFEFVFDASAVPPEAKSSSASAVSPAPVSTPSFSFGKPAAAAPSTSAAPSFSFSKPAATAATAPVVPASDGFSFTPLSGSSGFATPTYSLTEASMPVSTDAEEASAATDGDCAAGNSSNGLLGEGEGEEDETQLHEVRAKFWRFDKEGKSWKDLGIVVAKLKRNKETDKRRMLVRNEANSKVVVNFNIYASIKPIQEKNVVSFLGFDGSTPTQFRCKIKTEDGAKAFKEAIEKEAALL